MVKIVSRVGNKRKTGIRLLVGEAVGIVDLVERGSWATKTHAQRSSSWDQRAFGTADGLELKPLRDGNI
jgi:hypothetical protein